MFDLSTSHFQITWTLAAILVLAAAAAWRAASNWNVVRWRSIVLGVVAVLLLLFALNSMFTHSCSSSGSSSLQMRAAQPQTTPETWLAGQGVERLGEPSSFRFWMAASA